MATHSSVLAWRIPGTAEPGGLPSIGSHRQTWLKQLTSSPSLLSGLKLMVYFTITHGNKRCEQGCCWRKEAVEQMWMRTHTSGLGEHVRACVHEAAWACVCPMVRVPVQWLGRGGWEVGRTLPGAGHRKWGWVTDDAVRVLGSGFQVQICPWGWWLGTWRPSRAPASSLISLPEVYFITGKLCTDSAHPGSQPAWWEG